MSEQEKMNKLATAIMARSNECERGVVAIRPDGQAGIALVAPNSLMLAMIFAPEIDPFDFWLN